MKTSLKFLSIALLSLGIISCADSKKQDTVVETTEAKVIIEKPIKSVLTAEEQANMTPDEIIGRLKKGMKIL